VFRIDACGKSIVTSMASGAFDVAAPLSAGAASGAAGAAAPGVASPTPSAATSPLPSGAGALQVFDIAVAPSGRAGAASTGAPGASFSVSEQGAAAFRSVGDCPLATVAIIGAAR